ncbi:MAG: hypothetical protein AB7V50_05345 [Vampirovibrionia bacterium]
MNYPNCNLKCNGMLNCQQLDDLIGVLIEQEGREDTIKFYTAMLNRNYKRCPFLNNAYLENQVVSMY